VQLENKYRKNVLNGNPPGFSAKAGGMRPRSALIEKLRTDIRTIEQRTPQRPQQELLQNPPQNSMSPSSPHDMEPVSPACFFPEAEPFAKLPNFSSQSQHFREEKAEEIKKTSASSPLPWTFGVPEIDGMLPWIGLKTSGLHEIKPAHYRDMAAARIFALGLLTRRMHIRRTRKQGNSSVLWCLSDMSVREFGTPYGPGLMQFGLQPETFVMAQSSNKRNLLWTMEEGLKAHAPVAVLGEIDAVTFIEARRLALASETHEIPCLIISNQNTAGAGAALTRWRIASAPSASHTFDSHAPGAPRWHIILERTRHGPSGLNWTVEWSHEACCFRLVTSLANRTPETRRDRYAHASFG